MRLFIALLAAFCLLLAGCATQSPRVADADRAGFRAEGKLAARSSQSNQSAQFIWQQQGEAFEITVSGPVGFKAARLSGDARSASFRQGDVHVSADSADELAERLLGFPMPASALRYWLTGSAAPDLPLRQVSYDAQQRLSRFEQTGWLIQLDDYTEVSGHTLPTRIRVSHPQGQLILAIKQWQWLGAP